MVFYKSKQNQVIFYIIKGATIKKFIIIDCIIGTAIYFTVKVISSSLLIGFVGSIIGTEGIKRICFKR